MPQKVKQQILKVMEKLKQLLSELKADSPVETIKTTFSDIADILLFNSFIKTVHGNYRLLEIEFYFRNKNHKDDVTIKRKEKEGMWWLHDYGGIRIPVAMSRSTNRRGRSGSGRSSLLGRSQIGRASCRERVCTQV